MKLSQTDLDLSRDGVQMLNCKRDLFLESLFWAQERYVRMYLSQPVALSPLLEGERVWAVSRTARTHVRVIQLVLWIGKWMPFEVYRPLLMPCDLFHSTFNRQCDIDPHFKLKAFNAHFTFRLISRKTKSTTSTLMALSDENFL